MLPRALPTRREAVRGCAFAALTAVACAALLCAAVFAQAPPAVLPFLVVMGIACPMAATWPLAGALAVLRASHAINARERSAYAQAVATMRRTLDELPETDHPLGL